MNTQSKTKSLLKYLIVATCLLPVASLAQTPDTVVRRKHAQELLGKGYQKSIVKQSESITNLDDFIFQWTQRELRTRWRHYSKVISKTIMNESKKYGFDPVFLMAVIENESSFNPIARGSFGEIGLMQITPQTAEWIARKYHLAWQGPKSLKDPATNIILGAAYLSYLRKNFDFKSQLYLAAYNMGSRNVRRNLANSVMPKVYPTRVMIRYVNFYSKLSAETRHSMN